MKTKLLFLLMLSFGSMSFGMEGDTEDYYSNIQKPAHFPKHKKSITASSARPIAGCLALPRDRSDGSKC